MTENRLEIVDENDVVIGTASRRDIHANGLRHREAAVFFVTPQREIIFQRRSMTKDTFPGILDATAAGHVEIGDTYVNTAIKEVSEETGMTVSASDLVELVKAYWDHHDPVTKTYNRRFSMIYGYIYVGSVDDLVVEKGKADGFEVFSEAQMFAQHQQDQCKFPLLNTPEGDIFYRKLLALVKPT